MEAPSPNVSRFLEVVKGPRQMEECLIGVALQPFRPGMVPCFLQNQLRPLRQGGGQAVLWASTLGHESDVAILGVQACVERGSWIVTVETPPVVPGDWWRTSERRWGSGGSRSVTQTPLSNA